MCMYVRLSILIVYLQMDVGLHTETTISILCTRSEITYVDGQVVQLYSLDCTNIGSFIHIAKNNMFRDCTLIECELYNATLRVHGDNMRP